MTLFFFCSRANFLAKSNHCIKMLAIEKNTGKAGCWPILALVKCHPCGCLPWIEHIMCTYIQVPRSVSLLKKNQALFFWMPIIPIAFHARKDSIDDTFTPARWRNAPRIIMYEEKEATSQFSTHLLGLTLWHSQPSWMNNIFFPWWRMDQYIQFND